MSPRNPKLTCKNQPCFIGGHCSICGSCGSGSGSKWKGATFWYCGDCEVERRRRKCTWGDMLASGQAFVIANWWYPGGTESAYPFVRRADFEVRRGSFSTRAARLTSSKSDRVPLG